MMKKAFTLIELMIVAAIIAILAMIAVPVYKKYIENSRNSAAQAMLQQIARAERAFQAKGVSSGKPSFVFVNDSDATVEVEKLGQVGFRPDADVGFRIQQPAEVVEGVAPKGFIAHAAHRANGSIVYVYDSTGSAGVVEALAGATLAGIKQPDSLLLFSFNASVAAFKETVSIGTSGTQVKTMVKSTEPPKESGTTGSGQ